MVLDSFSRLLIIQLKCQSSIHYDFSLYIWHVYVLKTWIYGALLNECSEYQEAKNGCVVKVYLGMSSDQRVWDPDGQCHGSYTGWHEGAPASYNVWQEDCNVSSACSSPRLFTFSAARITTSRHGTGSGDLNQCTLFLGKPAPAMTAAASVGPGDQIRTSKTQCRFVKGYMGQWSEEIFQVAHEPHDLADSWCIRSAYQGLLWASTAEGDGIRIFWHGWLRTWSGGPATWLASISGKATWPGLVAALCQSADAVGIHPRAPATVS